MPLLKFKYYYYGEIVSAGREKCLKNGMPLLKIRYNDYGEIVSAGREKCLKNGMPLLKIRYNDYGDIVSAGRAFALHTLRYKLEGQLLIFYWPFVSACGACALEQFNPILHTLWLESHALTLKNNTARYYFDEKSSFLHTFLQCCGTVTIYYGSGSGSGSDF
jgi:hypothetical protein